MIKVVLAVQGSAKDKGFAYYDCATLEQAKAKRDALANRFSGVSVTIKESNNG
jgi:hypothetical protein